MNEAAVTWLREQIMAAQEYAQANKARRPITPMRSYEMRDLIAGCEADFAIIAACEPDESLEADLHRGDIGPEGYVMHTVLAEEVMRLLARKYRYSPGYAEHWGEPARR